MVSIETRGSALVVAIERYEAYPELQELAGALTVLTEALTSRGFVNVFPEGLSGGTSNELADRIQSWFRNARHEDRLFLYWSGHGKREPDGLYLLTHESPGHNLNPTNAVDVPSVAKGAANSQAARILIVLDVCFSGEALGSMLWTASRLFGDQPPDLVRDRGVAILASAHALQRAQVGILSDVLKHVLTYNGATRRWSDEDRFIDSDRLFASLSEEVRSRNVLQNISTATIGLTFDLLPNPRYRPGQVAEIVEERAWRLALSGSAEHFDLAARGIEVGQSGWHFAGRSRLLRALVDWLKCAEQGVRIVTGPPGAGKSAVLGRLATLSDPEYRKAQTDAGVVAPRGTVPVERSIDVAIHAKGKTLNDCVRALSRAMGVQIGDGVVVDVAALLTGLSTIERRITILIDALDEAANGEGDIIASRLIAPLGRLKGVRVLVGSRRSIDGAVGRKDEDRHSSLRRAFGEQAVIDDLEDETDTHEDIAEYVRLRMSTSIKHSSNIVGIAAAAERVAARSEGVFLYARIVSRTLQERDRLDGVLPATTLEAFADDLRARFGDMEQLVDDLLAGLAWAEGKGLTRRVWPLIATAVARPGSRYDDEAVNYVLRHAGWHIIESGQDGQAVYRLGHQALTDYYRSRCEANETQGRILTALTANVASAAWLDCDRYLRRHLADHASQAGELGSLISHVGYMAVAEPARLVTLLPAITDESKRRFADIYNRVADRLVDLHPLERLPLLQMTACMEAPDLTSLLEPPVPTRWRCRWASVLTSAPHRIIGRHSAEVTSIALGMIDARPVVVSGSADHTVRIWDARTGEAIGGPLKGHTNRVTSVAFDSVGGQPTIVSCGWDGSVRVWDARSGEAIGRPLQENNRGMSAVALGEVAGQPVVVSSSYDGTIYLCDLRTARIVMPALRAPGIVTSIAISEIDGQMVVLAGCDDRKVHLWRPLRSESIEKSFEGAAGAVNAISVGLQGGELVLASGSWDRTVRVWNSLTADANGKVFEGHTEMINAIAVGSDGRRAVIVSGSDDRTIRLWDAGTGAAIGSPLDGHTDIIAAVTLGSVDGRIVVVSGSDDQTVRIWDKPRDVSRTMTTKPKTRINTCVALGTAGDLAVVASGTEGGLLDLQNACSGEPIGFSIEGHDGPISAVAFGSIENRPVLVSGSKDRTVRLWDARTGKSTSKVLRGHAEDVGAVALGSVDGRAVVISGSDDRTICLWDVSAGALSQFWHRRKQARLLLTGHADKVAAVCFGVANGCPIVVSGSFDGTVRLWNARTGEAFGRPFEGHAGPVTSVALSEVDGRTVVVSGSHDQKVHLWDVRLGEAIGTFEGHAGAVSTVAVTVVGNREVVISGSDDGSVRLWNARTQLDQFVVRVGAPVSYVGHNPKSGLVIGLNIGIIALDVRPDF